MAKCDLCGEFTPANKLEQLLPSYQVHGVIDICPDCVNWANKEKSKLMDEIGPKMRQAIAKRLSPPVGPPCRLIKPWPIIWWGCIRD